jgi:hypothetical protein
LKNQSCEESCNNWKKEKTRVDQMAHFRNRSSAMLGNATSAKDRERQVPSAKR